MPIFIHSLTHSLTHSIRPRVRACVRTVLDYVSLPPSNLHGNLSLCAGAYPPTTMPSPQRSSVGRRIRTKPAPAAARTPLPDGLPLDRPPRLAPLLQLLGPLAAAALA